jgi:hypothetical protein
MASESKRKARLELWLGLGCGLLLVALSVGGYYRRSFQASWYRWRFLRGEKSRCLEMLDSIERLGPAGRRALTGLIVSSHEDLDSHARKHRSDVTEILVRNNRQHRVCLNSLPGSKSHAVAVALEWLMKHSSPRESRDRSAHRLAFVNSRPSSWVATRQLFGHAVVTGRQERVILDPGEEVRFWSWPGYVIQSRRPRPQPPAGVEVTVPIQP